MDHRYGGRRPSSGRRSDPSGSYGARGRKRPSGAPRREQPGQYGSSGRKSNVRVIREKPGQAALPAPGRIDISFFFLIITLLSIGIVMVFSASYATSLYEEGSSLYIVLKQAVFVGLGFIGMFAAAKLVPYTWYRKLAKPIYIFTCGLMALALAFPHDSGARRWIRLGGLTFQPSELMKFSLAVLFAALIAVNYKRMHTFKYGVGQFVLWLLPTVVLAGLQRHLSGLILLLIIGAGMMFIGGTKFKWFLMILPAAVLGGVGIIVWKGFGYIADRFEAWRHPFENIQTGSWQICQSLYAIGSGGLTGVGLGNSTQKFLWVSEPQNDFIFSIVCEELGLLGAVAIILLFVLFVCSGFSIAMRAPDRFSSLLVTGIILQFGVQALLNIAVVSNAMPTTGISLPFFSAGGTATVIQLCEMGVVLGISRYCRPTLSKLPDPEKTEGAPSAAPANTR